MTTVLAALDNSLAANPVLVTARAFARVLGASVAAIHVLTEEETTAQNVAEAAGVPLRLERGPVVDVLVEAADDEGVVAVVIGARGTASGPQPLGSTAFAVATSVAKPVVVVPPQGRCAPALRRVLVPLEGTVSTSLAPRSLFELSGGAHLDVVVLHVHEEIPSFSDQPQHESEAWAEEFLARYLPTGIDTVRLERRIGRREELVPLVAEETRADLIALGWTQQLEEGRAPVVQAALEHSPVPVLLVPVHVAAEVKEGAAL